jgi:predicted dehydrogenase
MKRVRWGILGAAKIARQAVIPAMLKAPYCELSEVIAIASRDLTKAQAAAQAHGIAKAYGSYDALLADATIDAVYIPLPNHLHVPFSILALQAGKHVLCEKPIALSAHEADQLASTAAQHPQLKVMEAFMYRHHPQWHWARQVVREGRIGDVRTIDSCFYFDDDDPAGILHHAECGGGCLMDIGCYPVSLSRFLFRAEPVRALARFVDDPEHDVDQSVSGILEFDQGVATFTCSTRLAPFQRVSVFGTRGRMELELPFNPPVDRPTRACLEVDGSLERIEFDVCDQYGIQADGFSRAILENTEAPTPIGDAVANMRVIDALVRSSRAGKWERLVPAENSS